MNDPALLSKNQIKEVYESYNSYFFKIMQNIIDILKTTIKISAQPTYKCRVKSFNSYYKKILRIDKEKVVQTDNLIYLTDIMGIRVICAFLEDLNFALNQIKSIFEIKEIEVKGADKKFSEFGYESIHVLIKIPDSCKPKLENEFKGLEPVSEDAVCEIQIRTILQDAWAEVEHELIYKTEFNPFDKPLRRKLASINASLSLADITFQEIRDYQNKLQKEIADRRKTFYGLADNLLNEEVEYEVNSGEELAKITPYIQGTIDDLILRAIEAHNNGNLDEAILIYSKILEATDPKDINVHAVIRKHRGMAYFAKNDFENAISDFKESQKCDPKNFRIYYYEGIVYSVMKEYDKAVESYSKSLEINEFQTHTHFRRAMAYYEITEYENAMNDLNTAIKLGMNPDECKNLQEKIVKKLGMSM